MKLSKKYAAPSLRVACAMVNKSVEFDQWSSTQTSRTSIANPILCPSSVEVAHKVNTIVSDHHTRICIVR